MSAETPKPPKDDLDAIDQFGPSEESGPAEGTVQYRLPQPGEEPQLAREGGATIAGTLIQPLPFNVTATLAFAREDRGGITIPLTKTVTILGRAAGAADLVLAHDDAVSRQHAAILFFQGAFFVEDLQSSNGTFVNGQRVERVRLNSGDEIRVGDEPFKFTVDM